jgi:hypothetical protein
MVGKLGLGGFKVFALDPRKLLISAPQPPIMVGEAAIEALTKPNNLILIAKSTTFAIVALILFRRFLNWYNEKLKEMKYAKEEY